MKRPPNNFQAGKRENGQFVDLSRLQFTSDESEFIPDYIYEQKQVAVHQI
jgi:hypothetical protein